MPTARPQLRGGCPVTSLNEYEPGGVTVHVPRETNRIVRNLASAFTLGEAQRGPSSALWDREGRASSRQRSGGARYRKEKAPQHRVFPSVTLYK